MTDIRENEEFLEMDFGRKMEWFKEEFEHNFGVPNQDTVFGKEDRDKYNRILNKMAETINQYTHEPLLGKLVEVYNEITIRYDKSMGE